MLGFGEQEGRRSLAEATLGPAFMLPPVRRIGVIASFVRTPANATRAQVRQDDGHHGSQLRIGLWLPTARYVRR
jgi:hypothetical protein